MVCALCINKIIKNKTLRKMDKDNKEVSDLGDYVDEFS